MNTARAHQQGVADLHERQQHLRIARHLRHFDRIGNDLPSPQDVMGVFGAVARDDIVEHDSDLPASGG